MTTTHKFPRFSWKLRKSPVNSVYSSSGFSSGSNSPSRSPNNLLSRSPNLSYKLTEQSSSSVEDKPLSLVIRKNTASLEDVNANVPEYTVHQKNNRPKKKGGYSGGSSAAAYIYPFAPSVQAPPRQEEEEEDSGAEEDLEPPPLVISEEEESTEPQDFSLKPPRRSASTSPPSMTSSSAAAAGESGPVLKIKDFAKFAVASPPPAERKASVEAVTAAKEGEEASDVSSECPSTLSSTELEAYSNMVEGKPYSGSGDVVVRRISRASTGETVYQCDFCEKMFANKSHFQSHLVTHTGERAFNCRICDKTFGRKSTLRAHMTTHTKVSNFMCTMCEKACNDNNSLEEHMRMHTGIFFFIF